MYKCIIFFSFLFLYINVSYSSTVDCSSRMMPREVEFEFEIEYIEMPVKENLYHDHLEVCANDIENENDISNSERDCKKNEEDER